MSAITRNSDEHDREATANTSMPKYVLWLFVTGILPNSVRAIKNMNEICRQHLKGNYDLQVIDIYLQPELAVSEQIIVIPAMIIKFPLPERRLIGDLSDTEKVLEVLNVK